MSEPIMAVFSNPTTPEQEEEYNTWYNGVHLKDLLAIPGVVGATRYKLTQSPGAAAPEHRYVALYQIEGDPAAVLTELGARSSEMSISPALDAAGAKIVFWEPVEGGSATR
jgi:hypothetical protein